MVAVLPPRGWVGFVKNILAQMFGGTGTESRPPDMVARTVIHSGSPEGSFGADHLVLWPKTALVPKIVCVMNYSDTIELNSHVDWACDQ